MDFYICCIFCVDKISGPDDGICWTLFHFYHVDIIFNTNMWFSFPFRLLNYFDGTRHVEDIMYCENLARSELCTIIDKFHPMLYEIQAPDSATSYYAKLS